MNRAQHWPAPGIRQTGTAAVEMALLSFVIAIILLAPIMIARSLMQVTVTQRTAYNVAHAIASYPDFARQDKSANLVQDATAMLADALVDGGVVKTASDVAASVTCPVPLSVNCQGAVIPGLVLVGLSVDVLDPSAVLPTFNTLNVTISSYDRYGN